MAALELETQTKVNIGGKWYSVGDYYEGKKIINIEPKTIGAEVSFGSQQSEIVTGTKNVFLTKEETYATFGGKTLKDGDKFTDIAGQEYIFKGAKDNEISVIPSNNGETSSFVEKKNIDSFLFTQNDVINNHEKVVNEEVNAYLQANPGTSIDEAREIVQNTIKREEPLKSQYDLNLEKNDTLEAFMNATGETDEAKAMAAITQERYNGENNGYSELTEKYTEIANTPVQLRESGTGEFSGITLTTKDGYGVETTVEVKGTNSDGNYIVETKQGNIVYSEEKLRAEIGSGDYTIDGTTENYNQDRQETIETYQKMNPNASLKEAERAVEKAFVNGADFKEQTAEMLYMKANPGVTEEQAKMVVKTSLENGRSYESQIELYEVRNKTIESFQEANPGTSVEAASIAVSKQYNEGKDYNTQLEELKVAKTIESYKEANPGITDERAKALFASALAEGESIESQIALNEEKVETMNAYMTATGETDEAKAMAAIMQERYNGENTGYSEIAEKYREIANTPVHLRESGTGEFSGITLTTKDGYGKETTVEVKGTNSDGNYIVETEFGDVVYTEEKIRYQISTGDYKIEGTTTDYAGVRETTVEAYLKANPDANQAEAERAVAEAFANGSDYNVQQVNYKLTEAENAYMAVNPNASREEARAAIQVSIEEGVSLDAQITEMTDKKDTLDYYLESHPDATREEALAVITQERYNGENESYAPVEQKYTTLAENQYQSSSNGKYTNTTLEPGHLGDIKVNVYGMNEAGYYIVETPTGIETMSESQIEKYISEYSYTVKKDNIAIELYDEVKEYDYDYTQDESLSQDEIKLITDINQAPIASSDPKKLKNLTTYLYEIHYQYYEVGTNNYQKSKNFSQEADRLLKEIEEIRSNINNGIWEGEGYEAAKQLLADLEDESNELKKDIALLEEVSKDVDYMANKSKELIETRSLQEQYEEKRDQMQKMYDELVEPTPAEEPIEKKVDGKIVIVGSKETDAHIAWSNRKLFLEGKISELNTLAEEQKTLAEEIDKELLKYEKAVENVSTAIKAAYQKKSSSTGSSGSRGGGGGGSGSSSHTPKSIELPDTTQEQMKYYQELTPQQLSIISANLQKFAQTNNITIDELLTNKKYSKDLISNIANIEELNEALRKLLTSGDNAKSQALLKNIFAGEHSDIVGLNNNTKESLKGYLTNVATNNNITLEELITDSKHKDLLNSSLTNYGNAANRFVGLNDTSIKDEIIAINDGMSRENLNQDQMQIIRTYTEQMAVNSNTDIETYYTSEGMVSDFNIMTKNSIFVNNLTNYSDEQLSDILTKIILDK